ncbi:hypothetical protein, partial [Pseudomonas syringae]|uniref:hypothetical protein n=1 Tax=Pseudomonas syringae TaxID=317 RepID=UPI001F2DD88A
TSPGSLPQIPVTPKDSGRSQVGMRSGGEGQMIANWLINWLIRLRTCVANLFAKGPAHPLKMYRPQLSFREQVRSKPTGLLPQVETGLAHQ